MQYESDLYSKDFLQQDIRRLPSKFYSQLGQHCLKLSAIREPNLIHLESGLHDRIDAQNDPYLSPKSAKQNHSTKDGYISSGYREGSNRETFVTTTEIGK